MELKGQTAFITGSTRGIGLAIAKAFAKQGVHIILNGRRPVSETLIAEIRAFGVECIGISGDISNSEEVKEMVKQANEFAPVTILVNNAGMTTDKLLLRMNEQDFEQVLKVNLTGSFNMTQQLLKGMLKQRKGTIINISSVSGLMGNVGQANYAASKAGLIGFTKTVAREIAPRKITCNAIAPGFIETDMTSELSDKIREEMTKNIPLQHFGQVEDIANTAVFLAKSPYITGQVINVDGGLVMNG